MKWLSPHPRQPFIGVALAAIAGVIAADRWDVPLVPIYIALGLSLLCVAAFRKTIVCWVFVGVAFFALHTCRHHHSPAKEIAQKLAEGNRVARAIGVVWSEPEPPQVWSRTISARFRLKLESIEFDGKQIATDAQVNVSWSGAMPVYGDRVELTGTAQNTTPVRNPGQFDSPSYLKRLGLYSEIRARYATDCRILGHDRGNPAQAAAIKARRWINEQLSRDLEDEPQLSALIASMVLGLKGDTPDEMRTMFQRTGTMHLFAVSGLNVAMLGAIAWFLLKSLRVPRAAAIFVIVPLLFAYALVTGLNPSCVRATLMGTLLLLSFLHDRRVLVFNSLAASAFLILAWDTEQIFSPGFQFSFVLVSVIVLLSARIQRRLEPLGAPDPFIPRPLWGWPRRLGTSLWSGFAAALGVSVSAWIGSLIFTAGYFHLFSASTVFANFLAVPPLSPCLRWASPTLLSAPISSALAVTFNNANWLCSQVPSRGHRVLFCRPRRSRLCGDAASLACADGGDHRARSRERRRGALAFERSRDWLVDCGAHYRYGQIVLPYLRSRGVNRLDAFVLTHGDAQHIGGRADGAGRFPPAANPRLATAGSLAESSRD